ncbi:TPA: XdhC family protein [Pluralibacter gergoviae]|uniref:XshC-Cox1 family protein n=2 Tax=Pluralibacter gergoviae TaxID=61647 RepID=A0A0J5M397_PLUGE|nr:XdhC family protein [Pluralibacter gergoviae]KMK11853.1 XshC-Cox1 family protein [Pluralibacter gergoviae]KMK24759.1 XshC-Cox1 family protein [Pluralibacter gergoviae]HDS1153052.1 XdhC family protein [Pluralibacter gergoviae]
MQSLDSRVVDRALSWLTAGKTVWLCTVLHSWGSAPRAPGAMLVADAAGGWLGSLSGGCIEEDFLQRLRAGSWPRASERVRYGAEGLTPPVSLPCGGVLDVLIERFEADAAALALFRAMRSALGGGAQIVRYISIGGDREWQPVASPATLPALRYDDDSAVLPVGGVSTLFLAGYSAVADECLRFALQLGFRAVVCEHRDAEFAQLLGRAGDNENVQCLRQHPARYLELQGAGPATAILCLTHDPRIDDLTLMEAVNTDAFYIGAMGSANNSRRRMQRLAELGGLSAAELARIRAPVGIAIGSKTPAEIALSALAEIVQVKNGR